MSNDYKRDIPIWNENNSLAPVSGSTAGGYYDDDPEFVRDCMTSSRTCVRKLGYPLLDVELQETHLYSAFEEAVEEYSSIINQFNIRENYMELQGAPTGSNLSHTNITPTSNKLIELAKEYGKLSGKGGDVTFYSGSFTTSAGQQAYDLSNFASDSDITIHRVFHNPTPVSTYSRMIDTNYFNLMNSFGWSNFSVTSNYMMMPLTADVLRIEHMEMNNQIRKSNYGIELRNNTLKLFPAPRTSFKVWFEYTKNLETSDPTRNDGASKQSDFSNMEYQRMTYSRINQPGKQWIRKYACAVAKEMLGIIRSKYESVPSGDSEISLDGDTLRTEGQEEKSTAIETLREMLAETSRKQAMIDKNEESEAHQDILNRSPLKIYIK